MGCCISKTTTRPKPPRRPFDTPPRLPPPLYYAGPSPPQPLSHPIPSPLPFEEESVKEVVISETPLPPPSPPSTTVPESPPPVRPQPSPPRPKLPPQVRQPQTPRKRDAAETDILISKLEQAADVVSEYSEMYTLSGSLSTATTGTTTTLADRKDSEVTSKVSRPVVRSSPNKPLRKRHPLVGGEERGRGASPPVRRLQQPSPERGRRAVVGQGRDPSGVRRNAGPARRDSGEISRRRSSSPAQGRAGDVVRGGMGKSPSKRTGSAGSRSSGQVLENGSNPPRCQERDPEEESSAGGAHEVDVDDDDDYGVVSRENDDDDDDDNVRGNDNAPSESLDNPHVSLECFIFL